MEQMGQSLALLLCARVLWSMPVGSNSANIADANAVGIMPLTVSTRHRERSALMATPVPVDNVVVANGAEPTLAMPQHYLFYGVVLALWRSRAMDNDFTDDSHGAG